jgi:alkylhydroperoxidase/carboxymuconolactone decarboxylase family protein YurZ
MESFMKIFLIAVLTASSLFGGLSMTSEAQPMTRLNTRQQAIVPIAAFTASGDLDKLRQALIDGLESGLTVNEIKEVLAQLYAYAGFPRSLNALGAFMEVMKGREAEGIKDVTGPEAKPLPADKSRLELGTANQTALAGGPVGGPLYEFAPAIDAFLKEHLFGDIFGRDNLDSQSREIATVAALANMSGVSPQLQAHFSISMNIGLSETQLKNLVEVLKNRVGSQIGDNASEGLDAVLENRAAR